VHRRTHSGAEAPRLSDPAAQQQQQQHPAHALPPVKAKAGRPSTDSQAHAAQDLISTRVYPALSPASIRDRLDSQASSGAQFFRAQHSASTSAGGSSSYDSPVPGSSRDADGPVQLDVGFEDLGLKLKSCGKAVLQGVTGRLQHGRLAAVMGPSGEHAHASVHATHVLATHQVLHCMRV
jgi:hypothetical protein